MDYDIILNGVTCGLGELLPMASFPELSDAKDGLAFNGLQTISTFREDPFQRLAACISQALATAMVDAGNIDTVVFTTGNSSWSEQRDRQLLIVLDSLGLQNARLLVAGGFSCGNTNLALGVAHSVLKAGEADRVLFASLDYIPDGQIRLTPPDIAVDADGTSAMVIASDRLGSAPHYSLVNQSASYSSQLARLVDFEEDMQAFIAGHLTGIGENYQNIINTSGLRPDDISHVITPNLNLTLITLIAEAISVDPSKIFKDNIARTSHAQSSDNIINLVTMQDGGRLKSLDTILMVACSNFAWSMSMLQRL